MISGEMMSMKSQCTAITLFVSSRGARRGRRKASSRRPGHVAVATPSRHCASPRKLYCAVRYGTYTVVVSREQDFMPMHHGARPGAAELCFYPANS